MSNIVDTIKKARKQGASDDQILDKIIESNPDKAENFRQAKERGASSSQILNKIIEDNTSKEEPEEVPAKPEEEIDQEDVEKIKEKVKSQEEAAKQGEEETKTKEKTGLGKTLGQKIAALKSTRFFGELLSTTRQLLVGVDISDYSIEILLLDDNGAITAYERTTLDEQIIHEGEILDQKKLSSTLKNALENTEPNPLNIPEHTLKEKTFQFRRKNHQAIVSLPESKTYVQVLHFENKQNLYGKINEKIEQTVPLPADELYWDFTELSHDEGDIKVLAVAALRDIVDSYIHFFKSTNVDPVAFDVEGAAIGRALLPIDNLLNEEEPQHLKDGKERMVLDLGARTTILNIFNEDGFLTVSASLPYAGNYLTKKVAENLDVSKEEAEKIKQEDGFAEDGRVYSTLEREGGKIIDEIKKARQYYKDEFNGSIEEILVAGGTSLLPEIDEFLDKRIDNVEVKIGDPLEKIEDHGLLEEEPVLYANVIGLGLRSLMDNPIDEGINLLPEEVKSQAQAAQQNKKRSVFITAAFIAIAGLALLGLAVYYLLYLPVPAPIQPLQDRIMLEMEQQEQEELVDTATIKEDLEELQVYKGPSQDQEVIGQAQPGESYKVVEQQTNWIKVKLEEGGEGWVQEEKVESIESTQKEKAELIDIASVKQSLEEAPVYKGPGKEQEVIGQAQPGKSYKATGQQAGWVRVELEEGEEGWVHSEKLEAIESIEKEKFEEEEVTKFETVKITTTLNFREEPSLQAAKIGTLEEGSLYELLDREDGWVMVKGEEGEGWVSADYVTIEEEETTSDGNIEETIKKIRQE